MMKDTAYQDYSVPQTFESLKDVWYDLKRSIREFIPKRGNIHVVCSEHERAWVLQNGKLFSFGQKNSIYKAKKLIYTLEYGRLKKFKKQSEMNKNIKTFTFSAFIMTFLISFLSAYIGRFFENRSISGSIFLDFILIMIITIIFGIFPLIFKYYYKLSYHDIRQIRDEAPNPYSIGKEWNNDYHDTGEITYAAAKEK